ncbi:MAG: phage/plasmid primase, P4 family [Terriglobales bacterium]
MKTVSAVSDTLTFSDAISVIDGKGSKGGWYNGRCPAHNDSTPSLGIKEYSDGGFAVKCQAGCERKRIIAALEQKTGKKYPNKKKAEKEKRPLAERGITLDQYAEMKKLPRRYLVYFGTYDDSFDGKPAIYHAYLDEKMGDAGLKYRLSTDSHDTFWKDHKPAPYGVAHLQSLIDYGERPEYVVICEGESDVQTLFYAGFPAIGISGKNGWKPEFAKLPQLAAVKEVYIVQEPDAEAFVEAVAASFPDKVVVVMPFQEQIKDPSELWLRNPDTEAFAKVFIEMLENAPLLHDGFPLTDTGNAERLVKKHGGDFRWLTDEEIFAIWNGSIWGKNKTGNALLPRTKEVVRAIPDPEWQATSEGAGKRHAMIAMTKGELPALAESDLFDKQPMLLNVKNGTLDLGTGDIREFRKTDFLTKQAEVVYDPFATCPKFDAFMDYIFENDRDTVHYILKALGYTLTGNVGESVFHMCFGYGKNGKTTLLEVLAQMLGRSLARPAKFSTFVTSKMYDQKYEIATFKGLRMVTAVEPRKAGHLDEEVLKQITGGDTIMARDIYEKNVVFQPEFKLWLAMNNKPRIVGTDEGIWRRVRLVPFDVTIPESMKVKEFHKVLFAEEGPGILNRLIQGCLDWQEEGLEPSGKVAKATSEFRSEQNVIQGCFDERMLTGKHSYHAKAGALYDEYRGWAEEKGEFVMRQNEFAEELQRRGFVKRRAHEGYEWWGITLKSTPAESEPSLNFEKGAGA